MTDPLAVDERSRASGLSTPADNALEEATPRESLLQAWRHEFQRALGVVHSDPNAARKAFADGVTVIRELQEAGQISEATAREILRALATLYAETLVSAFSEEFFGAYWATPPDFTHWLLRLK